MREPRHGVAERPEQQDVLGRVREVVLAADDVGDLHRGVVDDDREVIERRPVGADDDEVAAEVRHIDLDASADDVVEGDDPLPDPEPERASAAVRLARATLVDGQPCAAPDVAWRLLGRLLRLAVRLELLGRAVAGIRQVVGEQALRGRRVERQALHLAIRRVRSAGRLAGDLGALVPVEAEPVQAVEDVLLELDGAAGTIRVLEAQDERAADVAGVEEVEERRACGPDVQWTGRARRDPDADAGSVIDAPRWRRRHVWNSFGSASPGRTRTSAAGRRPSVARPSGPSSVSESSDSERARIVIGAPGLSARASRYESSPASSSASSVMR